MRNRLLFQVILAFLIAAGTANGYAAEDFAERFRTYRREVRAAKESFDKKDYQTAITHYSKAIELSAFEATSYYNRGIALYKTGQPKEAIPDFDKVILLDPRMVGVYTYRGLCHERAGEYLEALKDYSGALSMHPNDPNIHNNLAWLYATAKDEKIRDKARALEHAKKAAQLSRENNAEILDTLARAYFINDLVKEAIEAENKALKLSPGSEEFKRNLKTYEEAAK